MVAPARVAATRATAPNNEMLKRASPTVSASIGVARRPVRRRSGTDADHASLGRTTGGEGSARSPDHTPRHRRFIAGLEGRGERLDLAQAERGEPGQHPLAIADDDGLDGVERKIAPRRLDDPIGGHALDAIDETVEVVVGQTVQRQLGDGARNLIRSLEVARIAACQRRMGPGELERRNRPRSADVDDLGSTSWTASAVASVCTLACTTNGPGWRR